MTVAFQYTFREDDTFPTGLVSTDLSDVPARRSPSGPRGAAGATPAAPPPASACAPAA